MKHIVGSLRRGQVSMHVSEFTFACFDRLQRKLGITGDQVLQMADDLNIEAFRDDLSLSSAFWALEAGYRGRGVGKYGQPWFKKS